MKRFQMQKRSQIGSPSLSFPFCHGSWSAAVYNQLCSWLWHSLSPSHNLVRNSPLYSMRMIPSLSCQLIKKRFSVLKVSFKSSPSPLVWKLTFINLVWSQSMWMSKIWKFLRAPYLGLPIGSTKPRIIDFSPLVDRIERRLPSTAAFLNHGQRLTMVNSVLSSLPTYYICSLKLPKKVIQHIDRARMHCLWRKSRDPNAKVHSLHYKKSYNRWRFMYVTNT